jgi:outer membrane protein assembly factor BamB
MKKLTIKLFLFLMIFGLVCVFNQFGQGLAKKGWPKFMGTSLQNNGRSLYKAVDSPELKWVSDMGSDTRCKSISIGPEGTIYVGSKTKLFAINPDGTIKWETSMSYPSHITIGDNGFLRVGTGNCSNDKMYMVDAETGAVIWSYDLSVYSACGHYPSTLADDGTVIFGIGGYSTRYIFALNSDGSEKWKIAFGDNVETLPSITHDGNYIIAGNNLNLLYKVDINTGGIVASTTPPGGKYIYGHIAIADNGDLYMTSATYGTPYIYKYNSNLVLQWKKSVGSYHYVVPPSLGTDGLIYTGGTTTNKLFAFDANGDVQWDYVLDGDFSLSPVIDNTGIIYLVTKNYLYAIKSYIDHAELKWRFPADGNLNNQGYPQPAIAEDGTIYLLTRDGKLYALGINTIEASVNMAPDTLNLKSKGKWMTAYIEMADGYDVNDIDITSVELEYENQAISADWGDIQGNIYMVKFSRQALINILNGTTGSVELSVTGEINSKLFIGIDTIRVK